MCPSDTCDIQTSPGFQAVSAEDAEGMVYDEYAEEFNAFKNGLVEKNASYNL